MLENLERHEQTESSVDARRLADDCRDLTWSPDPAVRRLGALVDQHYRNANVRLAVAGPFLNRLVPQPPVQTAPFRDTIVGADVTGRSTTATKLTVLLVPDPRRLRLGLEGHGVVTCTTAATSGPATFYNDGESQFVVRKLFLCDTRRLNVFPAVAEAEATRSDLISLETDYDGVPLVGSVVRGIALSQHEDLEDQARWETEQKLAARSHRIGRRHWRSRRGDAVPIRRSGLESSGPAQSRLGTGRAVDHRRAGRAPAACGRRRAIGRLHTPPTGSFRQPDEPASSRVGTQQCASRLELDGHTFTLPELFAHLREKLNRSSDGAADSDLPEDVVVTFASEDSVRVSCHDGRVQVRIALAELSEGRRRWRDFAVVTHYRPDTSTLDIHFVRDGTIFLEGESLKGKPQITLRTIFSKVLSVQRGWGLLSPEVATDPRFADVTISQFTVDEGWIGLAYAPRPTAGPVARKPK